jgi:hypothetical protein
MPRTASGAGSIQNRKLVLSAVEVSKIQNCLTLNLCKVKGAEFTGGSDGA